MTEPASFACDVSVLGLQGAFAVRGQNAEIDVPAGTCQFPARSSRLVHIRATTPEDEQNYGVIYGWEGEHVRWSAALLDG